MPEPTGRVRLVASDLDGTLLGRDHRVSARTIAVIQALQAVDVRVVAATGRGWRSTTEVLAGTSIADAVCSNGAEVYDLDAGRSVATFPIAADVIPAVLDVIDTVLPERGIAWESDGSFGCDAAYDRMYPGIVEHYGAPVQPAPSGPGSVLKVLVAHPTRTVPEMVDALRPSLPDGTSITSSGVSLAEITGRDVNKATTLQWLCDGWDIHRNDVIAFGDNNNDIEMLTWAGRGVAMVDAVPDAVRAADERTTVPSWEDGVAMVLEDLLRDR